MQRIFDESLNEVGVIFFVIACAAIVITLGLLALAIWMLISGIVLVVWYQLAYADAGKLYSQVEDELGAGFSADTVFHSVFGEDIELPKDGSNTTVDWLQNSILGEEQNRAA